MFLVNIVPGLLFAPVVWVTIDTDKPEFSLLRGFDLIGLLLIAVFLGCSQYALEEGPRRDWLDKKTIRAAVIVSTVTGSLFFWRVLSYHQPIVDLHTFGNRLVVTKGSTFGTGTKIDVICQSTNGGNLDIVFEAHATKRRDAA